MWYLLHSGCHGSLGEGAADLEGLLVEEMNYISQVVIYIYIFLHITISEGEFVVSRGSLAFRLASRTVLQSSVYLKHGISGAGHCVGVTY